MKKIIGSLLLSLCFVAAMKAQVADSVSTLSLQSEMESMRQEMAAMSKQISQAEMNERNRIIWKNRSKHFNVAYGRQSLSGDLVNAVYGLNGLISDMAASMTMGKTWYLPEKPFFNMMKVGIDWSWADMAFARYSVPVSSESGAMQLDASMQIGPSLTINPVDRVKASAYVHFSPAYSMAWLDGNLVNSYVSYVNYGFSVAWRVLSFGIEFRNGRADYNVVDIESLVEDLEESMENETSWQFTTGTANLLGRSTRFYIGFRF